MRLLLDTNILITIIDARLDALDRNKREAITAADADLYVSVASLWEIAIKVRLGKLTLSVAPAELPDLIEDLGIPLLVIGPRHVLAVVEPEPATRDPFDRFLLAQCQVENFRLITIDRVLMHHPLAWQAG